MIRVCVNNWTRPFTQGAIAINEALHHEVAYHVWFGSCFVFYLGMRARTDRSANVSANCDYHRPNRANGYDSTNRNDRADRNRDGNKHEHTDSDSNGDIDANRNKGTTADKNGDAATTWVKVLCRSIGVRSRNNAF